MQGLTLLLAYSARTWEELIFRDELLETEARQSNFTFVATTTRGPRHRPLDFDRRIDRPLLHEVLARWNLSARGVYVCHANAFVEAATSSLILEPVPPECIRTECCGGQN